jgi:hypothetical protein
LATLLPRRVVGAITALFIAIVTLAGLAGPAQAEDGYQYWNYSHLENGKWAFSQVGAGDYQPKDGAVEGFRYGTSTQSQGIEPRADLSKVDFDTICADTKAATGQKRVAVVLDYGTEMGNGKPPAPRAECAVVANDASTQKVLGEVAQLRLGSGMVCAIDGYPATGCGEPVKNAKVPAHEETVSFALPSDSGSSTQAASASQQAEDGSSTGLWTAVGVAVLVVLIAAAALLMNRRSKTA